MDGRYDVSEAKNGKEACEFAGANPVDIILTDIKMPIMDGIELIQKLKSMAVNAKVIILSGYAYFEYAQKAVSLGACDYILKPIEEEKVFLALRKAGNLIEEEKKAESEKKSLIRQLNETLPVYFEHLMNRWLKGQLNEPELAEVERIFPFKGTGTIIVTKIKVGRSGISPCCMEGIGEIKTNLKYWIKTALDPFGHTVSFFLDDPRCIMASVINSQTSPELHSEACISALNGFMENMGREYGFDMIMGIGKKSGDVFAEAEACFEQAMEALSAGFYHSGEKMFHSSEIPQPASRQELFKSAKEDGLSESIRFGDLPGVAATTEGLFGRILSGGIYRPEHVTEYITRLALNTLESLTAVLDPLDMEQLHTRAGNLADRCDSFLLLKKRTGEFFLDTAEAVQKKKYKSGKGILVECMQHIDLHYMEDISLEEVAGIFRFHPNYFSGIFKNHTGISFSEYLCGVRMRHARSLLETSRLKVYEVAERVGYRDVKYFDRVFKKETGLSPEQYRKRFSQ
jgi:two-component system response regulator YesN